MEKRPKFNHAFDIAFEVHSDHEGKDVTTDEIQTALENKVRYFRTHPAELLECAGLPFDTYDAETQGRPGEG